ncbi:hypothetical protein [Staphylococcus epidermidis]|uniref:hypothetical protein n=2 Tax=Staphylococcus epidermidis TaxID=1282 RepID=UPI0038B4C77D
MLLVKEEECVKMLKTLFIIVFFTIVLMLFYFNLFRKKYKFANNAQKGFSIISFTFVLEIYVLFVLYVLYFQIFNDKNMDITVFIVSISAILFQQFLPKSFESIVLSEENTKFKMDKIYGQKMAIDFKMLNYVSMLIIIVLLILKFAHLVLKAILNY